MKNELQMNDRDDDVIVPLAEPELVKPTHALDEANDQEEEDIEDDDETEDDDERSGAL